MIITVTKTGNVELRDQDDFRSFKIVDERGLDQTSLAQALDRIASLTDDGRAAWVDRSAVPDLVGAAATREWLQRYGEMIEKAAKHGWVRASDGAVRAHVERPDS